MEVIEKQWNDSWKEYTLKNHDMSISFLNYGGIITKMMLPNPAGELENIVLGYEDYDMYRNDTNYFGAIIGRVAGRIESSQFQLDGKDYFLPPNEGEHHLHGGNQGGFHQVIWDCTPFQENDRIGVHLHHTSKDGENGYPGDLDVTVTYTLTKTNQFMINYEAMTSADTVLTLTNHTYFNLTGNLADTIEDHLVKMNAGNALEVDEALIPTGDLIQVDGTTFDFREGRKLATGITSSASQHEIVGKGYDHYFLLGDKDKTIQVTEPNSGRKLHIATTQPGLVLYTGNNLEENIPLNGGLSKKYLGVCFETQAPPASLHYPDLPSIVLKANERYKEQTVYTFEWH